MRRAFPKVFADNDGIQVGFRSSETSSREDSKKWTAVLSLVSFLTLPSFEDKEILHENEVWIDDIPGSRMKFTSIRRKGRAVSIFSPLAFLCYPGEPLHLGEKGEFDDSRWFSSRMRAFSDSHAKHKGVDTEDSVMNDAEMYGIAAVLKQLEDRGVVNDATIASAARMREKRARNALVQREEERRRNEAERKRKEWGKPRVTKLAPPTDVPLYRTIRCRRISGSDFAFEFEVEITSGKSDPMKAFELIQYQYADYIKNMYVISHPNADAAKMAVDFPHYELSNGHILGEAVVIALTPDSVSYDHLTRRGVVAVRFGAGQYEEARVWAKNNIEALVRDKNITLVTGSLPPQSRYYSLGETLKEGSILEIEFKTE